MRPVPGISPGPRAATGAGSGPDVGEAAAAAIREARAGLDGAPADVVLVFVGAAYLDAFAAICQAARDAFPGARLAGMTSHGVIAADREIEQPDAVTVWAASLPGATVEPLRYEPAGDGAPADWAAPSEGQAGIVLFGDPFSFPADAFLAWIGQAQPGVPVCGGLASAAARPGGNRLVLDDAVHDDGAVGLALRGVGLRTVVSQGCRPVGQSYVVTDVERNLVKQLAGAPPVERIREVYADADPQDQALMRTGLQVGTVIDEYREEYEHGDFLIRGVLGAHPRTGFIAVGDLLRVGQTVQFHVRDAHSADEDLRRTLEGIGDRDGAAGALLFTCNGRGHRLFGRPHHDAGLVSAALGGAPLAGAFCAGEFGPVAARSFLHGFTASLLIFGRDPNA